MVFGVVFSDSVLEGTVIRISTIFTAEAAAGVAEAYVYVGAGPPIVFKNINETFVFESSYKYGIPEAAGCDRSILADNEPNFLRRVS